MKTLLAATLLMAQPGYQAAVLVDPPTVQFAMDRPATNLKYHFMIRDDGTGTYTASYPPTPPATPGETVDAPLMLHAALARKIFEQARSTVPLHGNCETKAKNIAQTGMKTLTFVDAAGARATCTWNFSEKAPVVALQDEFLGLAQTLDSARKLRMEQRFDRLGMDWEISFLLEQVQAGHALGLETISPLLDQIIADSSLLERVRGKAKILLDMSRLER